MWVRQLLGASAWNSGKRVPLLQQAHFQVRGMILSVQSCKCSPGGWGAVSLPKHVKRAARTGGGPGMLPRGSGAKLNVSDF